jgi:hypothetical protein
MVPMPTSVNGSFSGIHSASLNSSFVGLNINYGELPLSSRVFLFRSSCLLTFLLLPPSPDKAEVIEVDIVHPECNREVRVVEFRDVEKDGVLHNGYEIAMEGDLRDLTSDKYKAQLVGENEILITMPSVSHYWLHAPKDYFEKVEAFNIDCPRTKEAHDVARNAILDDEDRQTKLLLLRFPENIALSNNHYSPTAIDFELDSEVVPFESSFKVANKQFKTTTTAIYWKIAIIEEKKRVVKAIDDKGKKGEAKLAQRFASMSF